MDITILGYAVALFLGLIFGSFAGATVWRIRARQVLDDEAEYKKLLAKQKAGKSLTATEQDDLEWLMNSKQERSRDSKLLAPLTKAKATLTSDRSRCLHCGHELRWFDLLPLLSWVSTGGACRYCKKPIGTFEPIIELTTGILFVVAYHSLLMAGMVAAAPFWIATLTMLVILFAYDLKWYILPNLVIYPLIACSFVYAVYQAAISPQPLLTATNVFISVVILSGLYFVLWFVSKGRLVGFGDVKLGLALGLLVMDWQLAIMVLFLANLIGTFIVLPGLLTHKLSRQTKVPFGPFLIIGFVIAWAWGMQIIAGYNQFSIWLANVLLML